MRDEHIKLTLNPPLTVAQSNPRLVAVIAKYPGPTDFKIKCKDRHFDVHKALMCANSPLIAAELKHGFKESLEGESEQEFFDADAMERMISFIYLADYEVKPPAAQQRSATVDDAQAVPPTDDHSSSDLNGSTAQQAGESQTLDKASDVLEQILVHVRVWAVGDYYRIFKLKALAAERLIDRVQTHWGAGLTPSSLIPILQGISSHTLRQDDLRTSLYEVLSDHLADLVRDPTFVNSLGATEGLQEFTADLLPLAGVKLATLQQESEDQRSRIAALEEQLKRLAQQKATELADVKHQGEQAASQVQERLDHIESVLDHLVEDLKNLPEVCRSARCEEVYGKLKLERKSHHRFGYGDYWIKCGRRRCGCRLNK